MGCVTLVMQQRQLQPWAWAPSTSSVKYTFRYSSQCILSVQDGLATLSDTQGILGFDRCCALLRGAITGCV